MSNDSPGTMRVFDPFLFLIGNRGAILRIAATPWAILVGAIFVISAGIARNYDHLVLTRQFEWIIGPYAASIVTTLFVYLWVWIGLRIPKTEGGRNFLTFLTLVWMTAPCAWIYGIPVEQFTDIVTATKWNIGFLAIVSLWRVVLMIRAICVLSEAPAFRVSLLILTPAACEMMIGAFNKGMSIVGIMGGVRLSPQDELLQHATGITMVASFWIFVLGIPMILFTKGQAAKALSRPVAAFPTMALVLAAVCTVPWALAALPHHEKLLNRLQLRLMFAEERYGDAVSFASSKQRSDFPAIHYLAPEPDRRGHYYPLKHLDLLTEDTPEWLREEWTNNAIEAFKEPVRLRAVFLHGLRAESKKIDEANPSVSQGIHQYAKELEEKQSLTRDERWWLDSYKQALQPETEESNP